jgi:hypothetical protein
MAVLMADEIKAGIKSGSFRADTSPRIVCDMIGGGLEVIAYAYMRTGRAIDVNNVTESISRTVLGGIQSKDATAESMAKLVQRLEHAVDRL